MSRCHGGAHALGYPEMVGWKRKIPVLYCSAQSDSSWTMEWDGCWRLGVELEIS